MSEYTNPVNFDKINTNMFEKPELLKILEESDNYVDLPEKPKIEKLQLSKIEMTNLVKLSIRECLMKNPYYHQTQTLVLTVYNVLNELYVNDKKYALLSAPTGSGKSIIGEMIHFCSTFIELTLISKEPITPENTLAHLSGISYFLTSSKVLQEQLEEDFERFKLFDHFSMLKGTSNYECTLGTIQNKVKTFYPDRLCTGMSGEEKSQLSCYPTCEYIQKRFEAARADCAVFNYSYFLNIMKMKSNPYFAIRPLTIADEAHLLPDIILSHFNLELTQFSCNKINKIIEQIKYNFGKSMEEDVIIGNTLLAECFEFFNKSVVVLADITYYMEKYLELIIWLRGLNPPKDKKAVFNQMFDKDIKKLSEEQKSMDYGEYIASLNTREADLFIESTFVTNHVFQHNLGARAMKTYKHTVNDMSEAEMCKKHFLSKIEKGVFMSATLGNVDEFAELIGMDKSEYAGLRLPSNFDFSNSPIKICKSGFLNYANFNTNITKIISDTLRICEYLHPNQKGIIHTSTFIIANKLQEETCFLPNHKRYLYYSNTEEKAKCIDLMKTSDFPYIIIGPSLYEGIDLKDDMARFNIIMKAPYSGMSEYIKKKAIRFPFWYERNTLEKLVQAIGRTNRHQKDWSVTYLLDSSLEKLIMKTQEFITTRLQYYKIP